MALTYEESAALMTDQAFKGRIKTACLHFANFIIGEQPDVPSHTTRYRWALAAYQNPDLAAQQVQPPVVMQDSVQAEGAAIPDDQLQVAVEVVVQQAFL